MLIIDSKILASVIYIAVEGARLGIAAQIAINEGIIEHILTPSVGTAVSRRSSIAPTLAFSVIEEVVEPEFGNYFRTKPKVDIGIRVPDDIVVDYVRSILRLLWGISGTVVVALQYIRVPTSVDGDNILKNIVVDVMTPLTDPIRGMAHDGIFHVIPARVASPPAISTIGIGSVNHEPNNGL